MGGEEFYQNGFVWSQGSDKIYANVRNAYGSLTATGNLNYYRNDDCVEGGMSACTSYIDFFAGAGAINFGHNNKYIKDAVLDYLSEDRIIHALDMHTPSKNSCPIK